MTDIRPLHGEANLRAAAELAAAQHEALRARRPFLPARGAAHFLPRIGWVADRGPVLGLWTGSALAAFLGGFPLDDYRNEGPATLAPDWCHGIAPGVEPRAAIRVLYREIAPRWTALAGRIHAICVYDGEDGVLEGLGLSGFGRFLMDAARPVSDLLPSAGAPAGDGGIRVRRAGPQDAEVLAAFTTALAAHIGASPIFMPNTRGTAAAQWPAFFDAPKAVAWIAERDGAPVGFIRAQAPQLDVTNAVDAPGTLAIDRLYVAPPARRLGVADRLLDELVRSAAAAGDALVSVDFETHNLEAFAFWTRRFLPVGWSLERRLPAAPSSP